MAKKYFSKLLLMGEYAIIQKGTALAIPLPLYFGQWSKNYQKDYRLQSFVKYLDNHLVELVDTDSFSADIEQGLFFDSNIPSGFGLGSSGALVAAVYDRYVYDKSNDIAELKEIFALMENHFHGASSGFDPLVTYLQTPLLNKNGKIEQVNIPEQGLLSSLFLWKSDQARKTAEFVQIFKEKSAKISFHQDFVQAFLACNEACIQAFLQQDSDSFFDNLKKISLLEWEFLPEMILHEWASVWKKGLESDEYYLKLCGAGGGGFVMGFSKPTKNASEIGNAIPLIRL